MNEVSTDPNLSTLEFQALETENTQLKEKLAAVRIKNDSIRDENVSIKKRYQDLYKSKAESSSNVSSRAAVPEKPKVLAPGLYAMTPKYIPPHKRNNKEASSPLSGRLRFVVYPQVIDDHDNTIPYHQHQLNNEVESVPTDVSSVVPCEISVITILDDLRLQLEGHIKTNKEQSFANDSLKADLERYKTQILYIPPLRVYDSEETLVQAEVSRTKMLEMMKDLLCKGSSKPINYANLNSLYDTFVPKTQLSREQVYWLPANEVASYNCNQSKPVNNFVHTRPAKSQVYTQLKMLKACFLEFDKVVKDRTTPSYITNREWRFEHTKKCFVEEVIPFYEKLKTHVKGIEDNLFKEVFEYMKIFDELDNEYDQCVIDKKSLEIENKNLLIQNECLLAESVSKDICSVVLTSDIVVPMSVEPRSNCVEEHSKNLELKTEI
ncbi:hypothetical protein Tco_1426460 [Tanacetum coccineum]